MSIDPTLQEFSDASKEAARLGGDVLLKWMGKITPQEKGFKDWVTQADFESQEVIQEFLEKEFPQHRFVGEESVQSDDVSDSSSQKPGEEFCWIVDPLDGTTNYVHQLRSFAVSIGLQKRSAQRAGVSPVDELLVGTVLDPVLKESYSAIKGYGATLNGSPIQSSKCNELEKSLFVFSFSRGVRRNDPEAIRFLNVLESAGSIRRLGSAALNLCYVACGRTDGYWATALSKWDVAAGWLIAVEAGATLADFKDNELDLEKPHFCVAATSELFEQIKPLLNV
ncbi:MAG: inositol monophosphatase [Mariniblastus sp.]